MPQSDIFFSPDIFFAAKTDRFSLVLFLSFVFLLFFCFYAVFPYA